jgi:hypothetical protein
VLECRSSSSFYLGGCGTTKVVHTRDTLYVRICKYLSLNSYSCLLLVSSITVSGSAVYHDCFSLMSSKVVLG